MKIALIQHLSFINGKGGTEKICSFLANHFCSLGYDVEVATNENIQGKETYPLNDKIKLVNIYSPHIKQIQLKPLYNYKGKNPFLWLKYKFKKKKAKFLNNRILNKLGGEEGLYKFNLRQRSKAWKKYIDRANPDLIITMSIGSLLEITFENEYDIPIINSTNGRPDYDYTDLLWYRSPIDMFLLNQSYKKLTAIQVLFENYKDFLPKTFGGKVKVIGNPIPKMVQNKLILNKERFGIINIASLQTSCKQQDIAIRIFARNARRYPDWDLHFWGEGNDWDYLKELIRKEALDDRIFLHGFTDSPLQKLQEADIFLFPSKYEGFPLALTEAMVVGLPAIGFESCSGVNQLIKHNENGFLAKNEKEMEYYLVQLIENEKLRKEMGIKGKAFAKDFFSERIAQQWEELVLETIKRS